MNIHHLNCISTCPLGGALMDGHSFALRGKLACHCILVESSNGLVLIDTGFGTRDVSSPRQRLSAFFLALLAPDFRESMTAIRQIESLGFNPADVRHIVLTHLDFDHAGGLDDFPNATVHVMAEELADAHAQRSWLDRQRYRPQQWGTRSNWCEHRAITGERWFGFESVSELPGLPPEILMIPLRGHTLGHAGIAVRTATGWLLQCGDAYFHHDEMDFQRPRCTPGLRFYQWMMEKDRSARLQNQQRLRELVRQQGGSVRVLSSHDPGEFEQFAHRPLNNPVAAGPRHAHSGAF
jgi:glyoxylase-like metal-dependent hydrolase (beta-lactamase superfamily II)